MFKNIFNSLIINLHNIVIELFKFINKVSISIGTMYFSAIFSVYKQLKKLIQKKNTVNYFISSSRHCALFFICVKKSNYDIRTL